MDFRVGHECKKMIFDQIVFCSSQLALGTWSFQSTVKITQLLAVLLCTCKHEEVVIRFVSRACE